MRNYETDVLVTGASGFLGGHFVKALSLCGLKVCALGRHPSDNTLENVTWKSCDLSSKSFCSDIPSAKIIVHLAQSDRFREFPSGALDIFNVNVASTSILLDFAHACKTQKFILASSGGVYGYGDVEFSENHPAQLATDLGYYLASKAAAESLVASYSNLFTTQILRFFFIFGPQQKASMLIPRLVNFIMQGKEITLSGEEGIRLNPIFVDDAVSALLSAMSLCESQKINVAGNEVVTLRALCNEIGSILNHDPQFKVLDEGPRHLVGKIEKMRSLLTLPKKTLREGLVSTISSIKFETLENG